MHRIRWFSWAAAAAASLICLPALAAPATPKVIASLTQPPGGLDCERAADAAKVVFDFQQPRSDVKQISVFVNGEGIPDKDVDQDWPTVTVLHGLEQGRNTVELVAKGKDGKAVSHKLVVLVGVRPESRDKNVAIVDCTGRAEVASGREPPGDEPWGEVLQSEDGLEKYEDEDYDEVVDEVVYEGPSYAYYPYPSFGYVTYAPVYYYPWPYYYSYYYYPYHRHHYHYGGYYRGDGYHHRSEPGRAYRDGYWGNIPRRYQPSRPPTHSDGGSAYRQYDAPRSQDPSRSYDAPRSYQGSRSSPSHSRDSGGRAWRGGGDRNQNRR